MALLSSQALNVTGLNATYTAVNTSDTISLSGGLVLHVKNDGAGSTNVTIVVPGTTFSQANPDVVVAVPAAANRFIHIQDSTKLATDNIVTVNYSVTTSVTAALMKLTAL